MCMHMCAVHAKKIELMHSRPHIVGALMNKMIWSYVLTLSLYIFQSRLLPILLGNQYKQQPIRAHISRDEYCQSFKGENSITRRQKQH